MKKNLLYGFFALSMAIMGISSCAPMDSDDHSLGGSVVSQDALSLTVSEGADNTYTITNSSQDLDDIRYFISTDGKKLEEFAVGASITCQFKKKGSYPVYLYAFSACDQKVLSHNIEVTENWVDPNAPTDDPTEWLGFTAGTNLFEGTSATLRFWFADGSWTQIADPDNEGDVATGITFTMNGCGSERWQAQMQVENTGIVLSAGKTYDFSVVINSSVDGVGATVKPQKEGDDGTFFTENIFPLHKGNNVIALTGCVGFDGNLKVAFDFAGAPEGTVFTVKNFFITEHHDANVIPLDYNSADNIWKAIDDTQAFEMSFWWADSGWAQIGDPGFEANGRIYTITSNSATAAEWQAQNVFNTTSLGFSADDVFDFSCVVMATADSRVTVKLCQIDDDDNQAFYKNDVQLKAGKLQVIKFADCKFAKGAASPVKLIYDFGGCEAGVDFVIANITIIKK